MLFRSACSSRLRIHPCADAPWPASTSRRRRSWYAEFQSIKFALLETNGQLSVLPFAAEKPVTAAQMGVPTQEPGLPVVLISDGRLLEHNLKGAGYEHNWLEKQLAVHGLRSPRQALLLTVDEGGNTYCVPKKEAGV